jgi:hypothetical protein
VPNITADPVRQLAAALEAAGLAQSSMANRLTQEELLDNLQKVAAEVGREPILEDMNRPP